MPWRVKSEGRGRHQAVYYFFVESSHKDEYTTSAMSHVRVAESPKNIGRALYATAVFEPGEFVAEYTGVRIPTAIADSLTDNRYLFELDSKWTIDGTDESNIARFINHSCEPNCEAEIRDGHIIISASEPIQSGEEFTIDYGEEYFKDFLEGKCLCGSMQCRSGKK